MVNKVHVDDFYLASLIEPEVARYKMSQSGLFKKTNKYWNIGRFNYIQKIGSLSNIASDANRLWMKDNEGLMSKPFFVEYYLNSKGEMLNKSGGDSTFDLDARRGRSMQDLYMISKEFRFFLKKKGIRIDEKTAFNYVLIRVLDQSYEGFLREVRSMDSLLKDLNKDRDRFIYYETDVNLNVFYSIDFILEDLVEKTKYAIQIKPEKYMYKSGKARYKQINNKKFRKFHREYRIGVFVIYSTSMGEIIKVENALKKNI